jgi:hypothetical protein
VKLVKFSVTEREHLKNKVNKLATTSKNKNIKKTCADA